MLQNLRVCKDQLNDGNSYSSIRKDEAKSVVPHNEIDHRKQNGHNPQQN